MSKELTCPECQSTNTPGSKFCNNCGHRLPPSTSLICPNCSTPNPRDRFYCDNCGSRLVKESPAAKGPEEDKPPPQTGTFFSLPARPPGQTGELDPLQIVPDWLKKQAEEPPEDENEEDLRLHMPKIEEVGPSKKATDDLPDWLVDEHDSDPIVGSPRVITTEHFMNLVQPPEGDEAEDLTETAGDADLPDWLTDLAGPAASDKAVQSGDLSTPDDALNEWLSNISGDEPEESPPDEVDDLAEKLAGLSQSEGPAVDWVEEEAGAEVFTDWLIEAALEPPDTDWQPPDDDWPANEIDSLPGLGAEDQALGGEMFDWMAENLVDSGMLDASAVADDETEPPGDETDWLTDFADAADEEPASRAAADAETAVPPTSDSQPDWMAEFTTADSESLAQEMESKLEALDKEVDSEFAAGFTDELRSLADDSHEWLDDFAAPGEPDESEAAKPDELSAAPPIAETDWLSEMVAMGDEAFAAEETEDVADTAVPDQVEPAIEEPISDLFAADWPEEEPDAAEQEAAEAGTSLSDWGADSLLINALDEELPDWLDELGAPVTDETALEPDAPDSTHESMPDWIAQMKPGSGFSGSGLTESSGLPDLTESYADLPDGLVGQGLPDWLQDADEIAAAPMASLEEAADIPEWLADSIPSESEFSTSTSQPADDDKEWTAVLQDLPPAAPIEERMAKADIPDWILALQPGKLTDDDMAAAEEDAPVHEGGPLAGIRNVIEIEPIIAEARTNGLAPTFTISQEQMSQAALLKQLALADQGPAQSFRRTETSSSSLVRLLLAGLLLAAIFLGLLRPNLLQLAPAVVPPYLSAAHSAIEDAAGAPVLLAVEYTPAMSGELDAPAEMILAQLAANGSPVVTVSQSAAGTAVTQRVAGDTPPLGLLPGQSVGLRQLGDCLAGKVTCNTLAGKTLTGTMPQLLNDVALIIVLTGERDSLVGWLEQMALSGDIPLVAGVTQSLAPVARPYLDTAQLQGMIGGLPETAVYQQELLNQTVDDTIMRQLSAQTLAQLLAAVLLLVGGLTFGISNLLQRGGKK